MILAASALIEAVTGVVLLVDPVLVVALLFGVIVFFCLFGGPLGGMLLRSWHQMARQSAARAGRQDTHSTW